MVHGEVVVVDPKQWPGLTISLSTTGLLAEGSLLSCAWRSTPILQLFAQCYVLCDSFRFGGDAAKPSNSSEDSRSAAREPSSQCLAAQAAYAQQVEAWLSPRQPRQRSL